MASPTASNGIKKGGGNPPDKTNPSPTTATKTTSFINR